MSYHMTSFVRIFIRTLTAHMSVGYVFLEKSLSYRESPKGYVILSAF